MLDRNGLQFSADEIAAMFANQTWGSKYPPILDISLAAKLAYVPIETVRSWRSRGLLANCSYRTGKRVLIARDRFVAWLFGAAATQDHNSNSIPQ